MTTQPGNEDVPELPPDQRARGWRFLWLAMGGVGFTLAMQMGLNANFMATEIGVSGLELGMLEALRETCGISALFIMALFAGVAEPIVSCVALLFLTAGIGAYMVVPNYTWVMIMSLVWSQGLHVWMPLPRSMAMAMSEKDREGHRLGQTHAAGAAGFAIGLAAAYLLTLAGVPMRPLYLVAGVAALVASVACLGIPLKIKTPGPRIVFKKRYARFYLLSFLEGWRKQIFICFAGFLLVRVHGASLRTILLLFGVVQVIGYVASPRVGKLIDRVGERAIMVFYFACLTLFFAGYALISTTWVLYVIFVVDNAFFVFAMALTTYANRLAPPSERTPTLTMGVAMNHAAAVTMPLVGGILWTKIGYQWAFAIGSLAALFSVGAAWRLPARTFLPASGEDGNENCLA